VSGEVSGKMVEGKVIARYIPNSWKCPVNLDVSGDLLQTQMFNSSKSNIFQLQHRTCEPLMHHTLPYACNWTQIHQTELLILFKFLCMDFSQRSRYCPHREKDGGQVSCKTKYWPVGGIVLITPIQSNVDA
jgi:hypothetical protein